MWDAYAKDPSGVLDWQLRYINIVQCKTFTFELIYILLDTNIIRYMNFMFDLEDASNDGTIDAQEFALVCSSYGLDANECEQAFAKMSKVSCRYKYTFS